MTNWDMLRRLCSQQDLVRWLEQELGDGVPADWDAWLGEEAEELGA